MDDHLIPQVRTLLEENLSNMCELSPPDQVIALDINECVRPTTLGWFGKTIARLG